VLVGEDEMPAPGGVVGLAYVVGRGHDRTLPRAGREVNSETSYFPLSATLRRQDALD
jgi:hypothetical protein